MRAGARPLSVVVFAVLGIAMGVSSGCAKAHARTVPEGPALQVPQPPARVIVAASEPPPLPVEEPLAQPVPPVAPPAVTPRPVPAAPARVARPEPPDPPAAARVVPRTLRAPGDVARERAIRDRLSGATADLGRVDYAKLEAAARGQFDQARRFVQQAEQAIKDQNLAFASTLADKAATLAADLAGR